jgi:hypothetical protein
MMIKFVALGKHATLVSMSMVSAGLTVYHGAAKLFGTLENGLFVHSLVPIVRFDYEIETVVLEAT